MNGLTHKEMSFGKYIGFIGADDLFRKAYSRKKTQDTEMRKRAGKRIKKYAESKKKAITEKIGIWGL